MFPHNGEMFDQILMLVMQHDQYLRFVWREIPFTVTEAYIEKAEVLNTMKSFLNWFDRSKSILGASSTQ